MYNYSHQWHNFRTCPITFTFVIVVRNIFTTTFNAEKYKTRVKSQPFCFTAIEFFTTSPNIYKNANIANFVLIVAIKIKKVNKVGNLKRQSHLPTDISFYNYWHHIVDITKNTSNVWDCKVAIITLCMFVKMSIDQTFSIPNGLFDLRNHDPADRSCMRLRFRTAWQRLHVD